MNEKLKQFLKWGIGLAIVTFLAELIFLATCSGGLGCLAIGLIYETPGLVINQLLKTANEKILFIIDIIFYFILGGVIGLIIHKIRNK